MKLLLCYFALDYILVGAETDTLWFEQQRYDGWFNNLQHHDWGATGTQLHRLLLSDYSDGVYRLNEDLPNAREISLAAFQGADGLRNQRNLTVFATFFSQVIAYEILQGSEASCPVEMAKVPIAECDAAFDTSCSGKMMMPFFRSRYDKQTGHGFNRPRQQTNERTAWIDGSFIYGTSEPWINVLRSFTNGTLSEGSMPDYPPENVNLLPMVNPAPPHLRKPMAAKRLFLLGDPRVNENPGLLSFALLFFRYHNRQADRIREQHPDWTDEHVFARARQFVIATLQHIIYDEFLPQFLNRPLPEYTGYNPAVSPAISHVFAGAVFRYPHTLVPSGLFLRNGQCRYRTNVRSYPAVRLCNSWWQAQEIIQQFSMDEVILGMASQISEADDSIIVEDLRDSLFGPLHFSRRDLSVLSIMRGRDYGLPTYNAARKALGLEERRNWEEINPEDYKQRPQVYTRLSELYGSVDRLELFVGGMLEADSKRGIGELFASIMVEQFARLRNGDRFWYQNTANGIFTTEEAEEIRRVRMSDIIHATTGIEKTQIQKNVFIFQAGDPCPQPFQVKASVLEECAPNMLYDYFMGDEITFIFVLILLGIIPIICGGVGFLLIRQRRKHYGVPQQSNPLVKNTTSPGVMGPSARSSVDLDYMFNQQQKIEPIMSESLSSTTAGKVWSSPAIEWLHHRYSRSVIVSLEFDGHLVLRKRRSGLVRSVYLIRQFTGLTAILGVDATQPLVLLDVPNEYDVVLRFDTLDLRTRFLSHLARTLSRHGVSVSSSEERDSLILAKAVTKQKRQRRLEKFFREAYAKAFSISDLDENVDAFIENVPPADAYCAASPSTSVSTQETLSTYLTRTEFAEALGMTEDDPFVMRMFACVARQQPDKVAFQEFLDMVIKFSNGNVAEKLHIVFRMCDRENSGVVDKQEFNDLVASLVSLSGAELTEEQQKLLINSMLSQSGIDPEQKTLNYKQFERVLGELKSGQPIGLHFKGRRQNYYNRMMERESINSFAITPSAPQSGLRGYITETVTFLEDYRQHVAWLLLYFSITFALFMYKFRQYNQLSEHRDLRRVMGVGIAFTRGAAAGISFSYAVLLLTVARSIHTLLRETWVNQYIPFDAAITFHKVVAVTALIFSVIHTVGHCCNFYHVSTQPVEVLNCLFPEAIFSSDARPSMWYWFANTITGVTGILLVVLLSILYVFAVPSVVDQAYHAFHLTHMLHVAIYLVTVLHGMAKMTEPASFGLFIAAPVVLLIIDRVIDRRRRYIALQPVEMRLLVSDVTYIRFKRPRSFHFRSGQWVQMSCPVLDCRINEWHAFSLASAPHDHELEVYIKAQGPWTWKIRQIFDEALQCGRPLPPLHMMGPYGGGNQDWCNFEVAVMVGGGIGVTPYASMLLDLAHATSGRGYSDVATRKVYFIWVCQTHRHFEWFIDILRRVEELDLQNVLEMHIFITQFFHKFDLRTTMLYICEKHFQRVQGRSMFTYLKARNHFGRPNMNLFLQYVREQHIDNGFKSNRVGVFSCGPGTLNKSIRQACEDANKERKGPRFIHRYETF